MMPNSWNVIILYGEELFCTGDLIEVLKYLSSHMRGHGFHPQTCLALWLWTGVALVAQSTAESDHY